MNFIDEKQDASIECIDEILSSVLTLEEG